MYQEAIIVPQEVIDAQVAEYARIQAARRLKSREVPEEGEGAAQNAGLNEHIKKFLGYQCAYTAITYFLFACLFCMQLISIVNLLVAKNCSGLLEILAALNVLIFIFTCIICLMVCCIFKNYRELIG